MVSKHNKKVALKLQPDLIALAREKFLAGCAREAARLLQRCAADLAKKALEDEFAHTALHLDSDRIAQLGADMLYVGDSRALKEREQQYRIWATEQKALEQKCAQLFALLVHFEDLLLRFFRVIEEQPFCNGSFRNFSERNIFEDIVRGYEVELPQEEMIQYLLGRVREDILDSIAYAESCSVKGIRSRGRPRVVSGKKHEFLAILLELQDSPKKLQQIKNLQENIREKRMRPTINTAWWSMTEEERRIDAELQELKNISSLLKN